jgi:16S rRNA (cytidine1402-2'-O)-methyltransferase
LADLASDPRLDTPRGEIVVIVGPPAARIATRDESEAALREAVARLGPSAGAAEVARALGLPRRDLYSRALALRTESP